MNGMIILSSRVQRKTGLGGIQDHDFAKKKIMASRIWRSGGHFKQCTGQRCHWTFPFITFFSLFSCLIHSKSEYTYICDTKDLEDDGVNICPFLSNIIIWPTFDLFFLYNSIPSLSSESESWHQMVFPYE